MDIWEALPRAAREATIPRKPAAIGGKNFLATPDGLWVVSDSQYFNGEQHRGITFVKVPAPVTAATRVRH